MVMEGKGSRVKGNRGLRYIWWVKEGLLKSNKFMEDYLE